MNMKRWISLIAALAVCVMCAGASANSWGLSGALYGVVEQAKTWDNYSTEGNQAGPFAVMGARYHNALFYVDGREKLHVYTTAAYQPERKKKAPKLTWKDNILTIQYSKGEEVYRFILTEEDGDYQLLDATVGGISISAEPDEENRYGFRYVAEDKKTGQKLAFPVQVLLSGFNIELFPRSLEEVRHINYMKARFYSGRDCLGTDMGDIYSPDAPGDPLEPEKKGTAAVYSAPYGKSAWRAGKGKAAVGLNGLMWELDRYKNEDGVSYACIRYDVSERTQRIGYALCSDLGLPEVREQRTEPGESFVHVDVEATADTYLTDDPNVSQFHQFTVPKGTQFSCMGLYNDYYAYVSAEVKNGKFTDGGAIVWGFVPLRDLKPMEKETLPEAMKELAGDWKLEAGGEITDSPLRLRADGTFSTGNGPMEEGEDTVIEGTQSGTWYVTAYNPFMNLYWGEPQYEMTLLYDNGRAGVYGVTLTDPGFALITAEGSGGYVPLE